MPDQKTTREKMIGLFIFYGVVAGLIIWALV